ncbi:MAG: class I SAM-dependent methyltransferase, partial [Bacteroidetes bacterium]|nr:class I SAM-dependent methyltransferase [Bacteroidota bacterium]
MKELKYTFRYIDHCNMCNADNTQFKVLGKRLNQSHGMFPKTKMGISTTIIKCKICGLIFSNPQPIPDNLQDHYGTPPEEYWKDSYFEIDENYFSGEITWLKQFIEVKTGIKTLDIGAGLGKCMIALTKIGCETYGLEPSEHFYQRAIEKMGIS